MAGGASPHYRYETEDEHMAKNAIFLWYRIPMATIGHWNKEGIMFEEFLFWDNGEFMKQIGLAP